MLCLRFPLPRWLLAYFSIAETDSSNAIETIAKKRTRKLIHYPLNVIQEKRMSLGHPFAFFWLTNDLLNVVSRRRCVTAGTCPVGVEEFTTLTVDTLISVSTEVVTLCLQ